MVEIIRQPGEAPRLANSPSEGTLARTLANIREMLRSLIKEPQNPEEVSGYSRREVLAALAAGGVALSLTTCAPPNPRYDNPDEDDNSYGESGSPITEDGDDGNTCYSLEEIRSTPELLAKFEQGSLPNGNFTILDNENNGWKAVGTTLEEGRYEVQVSYPSDENPEPEDYISIPVEPYRTQICERDASNVAINIPDNPDEPGGSINLAIFDTTTNSVTAVTTIPPKNSILRLSDISEFPLVND